MQPWTWGWFGHLQHSLTLHPRPLQLRSKAGGTPEKHSSESTGSSDPAVMGFQQRQVTKQKARNIFHFPQSSGQAQPSTCGCGFRGQCLVFCVWKPGSVGAVGDCSVCVKVLFEKKIYTPVGSVSCNPFFTTTVHILQGHFLSHTGTSWKTYKFKRKDLPIV